MIHILISSFWSLSLWLSALLSQVWFCSCGNTTFLWWTNDALITFCFSTFQFFSCRPLYFHSMLITCTVVLRAQKPEYFVYLDCSRSMKLIIFKSTYIVHFQLPDLINYKTVLISSYLSFFIWAKYAMRTESYWLTLWFPTILWFFLWFMICCYVKLWIMIYFIMNYYIAIFIILFSNIVFCQRLLTLPSLHFFKRVNFNLCTSCLSLKVCCWQFPVFSAFISSLSYTGFVLVNLSQWFLEAIILGSRSEGFAESFP